MLKAGLRRTGLSFKEIFLSLATAFAFFSQPKASAFVDFEKARQRMIESDLKGRGIHDERVLRAMAKVPRQLFVPSDYRNLAYADSALPIEQDQTISQPYIVALMTQSARLQPTDKVLEVGTGSGYQAAVLAEIVKEVYTIEIHQTLAWEAADLLHGLGYANVQTRWGDGYQGWKDAAPFDVILITAAAPEIPEPLVEQLKIGGRMVLPLGPYRYAQELVVLTRKKEGLRKEFVTSVVFVPMTGEINHPPVNPWKP
ncbi:MAG: protein-L-isoaspartate(D-aspartate) O-methyltransferase [Nitrospinaceae bacterium]|nr:protein-L-isoaspartate(D-aspartate) O-methyltransferase [Nitrospinaceae bacterium]NIR56572.1 protein-L-isoaspartate(D-aspartate) O-methyltransferase [Nitrospinaceae bacterium]NIS87034.1 protein-L-isoaspartate(D-aspartate) O-methyltransferase [Nitrospinaceae bacterium]NIT83878.1 protein-L-isoaspartate(D-aspartate) O-methyltransferase [Nitrospinaceae bacterium]NIU46081.1 protein-L-isoaspartate(D-aspartate) O-methyltransferase [Nitrospinaceae bacterium]